MRDYLDHHLTFDTDFIEFAEEISRRYTFALLSNDVSSWSAHITSSYGIDRYFSDKIVSADVHARKPEPEIFEITVARLGVPGSECVFVDNSVKNLEAAKKFGMDTVLFNRDGEEYAGKIVYSFDELRKIL
jgi:putative hydrolase of the HAD superfamily